VVFLNSKNSCFIHIKNLPFNELVFSYNQQQAVEELFHWAVTEEIEFIDARNIWFP